MNVYNPVIGRTKIKWTAFILLLLLHFGCGMALAADPNETAPARERNPVESLPWQKGPMVGDLRARAEIHVPEGFRFLPASEAAKLLVLHGNRASGRELGLIENIANRWWVVFEFDEIGYVKDDEKDKLDADKLLKTIKQGAEEGNKYRVEKGIPPMNVLGWHVPPNFNDQTKNLEWSILAESEGHKFVNYNVRLLGRKGVTEITLVDGLETVDNSLGDFRELLKAFNYKSGESYAEFRKGDQIAKYGLGALVVGGAAAVAYKVGLLGTLAVFFKKMWKLIILALVASFGFLKRLIVGRSAKRELE